MTDPKELRFKTDLEVLYDMRNETHDKIVRNEVDIDYFEASALTMPAGNEQIKEDQQKQVKLKLISRLKIMLRKIDERIAAIKSAKKEN